MSNKLKSAILENQKLNNIHPGLVNLKNKSVESKVTKKQNKKEIKKENKNNKMKANKSIVAMAIAKGRQINETIETKRYIGVAACKVIGINPTKAELDKIYGRTNDKEVSYVGETEVNGVKVPQARIDILFKLADEYLDNNGKHIDTIFRKSFFITKTIRTNRENTKVQVIDEYGNTAWVTNEQLTTHEIPMYSNGPANISKNYRPLYRGEESLTNFIKVYLNIPNTRIDTNQNPTRYNYQSKSWEVVKDASDGLIRFDNIDKFFSGDFKEIQDCILPKQPIKILIGIRNVDGKMYQDIFDVAIKGNATDYSYLEKDLNEAKANGAYPNTEFKVVAFQEYSITPTTFSNNTPVSSPFDSTDDIF